MSTITSYSEIEILTHIVAPDQADLPPESAKSILSLRFDDDAVAKLNELAEKNRLQQLTDEDRVILDRFLRVGHFMNLMQARARLSLSKNATP
jgi:hypothetical protein